MFGLVSREIAYLKRENSDLRAELERVRAQNIELTQALERQSEKMIAINSPQVYHQYVKDKNTSAEEREVQSELAKNRMQDLKGMEELGILSNGMMFGGDDAA